jgi:hypothetical protein
MLLYSFYLFNKKLYYFTYKLLPNIDIDDDYPLVILNVEKNLSYIINIKN